ncbi:MAG: hypothetical protein HY902_17080 [Deltaproteobacteria bacterium]|nr:hypothetical protein [Deltaproteobacteria bacterium]
MVRSLLVVLVWLVQVKAAWALWVVSPQMQPLLAQALTDPQAPPLGDGYRPQSVVVRSDRIQVVLQKAGAESQQFDVTHPPSDASPAADDTRQFHVDGPQGPLRTALIERLRGLDDRFAWTQVEVAGPAPPVEPLQQLSAIAREQVLRDPAGAKLAAQALAQQWPAGKAEPALAWGLAVLLAQLGDRERAGTYQAAVIQATGNLAQVPAEALPLRAAALASLGRADEAELARTECRKRAAKPEVCEVYRELDWYNAVGQWPAAAALMDRQLGDGQTAALADVLQRAALAGRMGDAAAEMRWAKVARARFRRDPDSLALWATACFRDQQFEEAVAAYEELYRVAPDRPSVLAHLSGVFNRMHGTKGRPDIEQAWQRLAAKLTERARDPVDVVAQFLYAVKVFYDADFEKAIPLFHALEARLPHEARVPIYLAMGNYWSGHQAEAENYARKAVAIGPLDPDVYYVRSKVFQDQDARGAARDLRRYIELAEAPGAIAFADKTERVRKELEYLDRGERPPDWDRPGFDSQGHASARWLAIGLAIVIGVWVLWRRRREARAE